MANRSFSEELWNGLGDAIADIREKVVEEPWFGRVVTERGEAAEWPSAEEPSVEQQGMSGEILGPEHEAQPASSHHLLERGQVIDNEPAHWPDANQQTHRIEQQREQDRDVDIDR